MPAKMSVLDGERVAWDQGGFSYLNSFEAALKEDER